MNKLDVGLIPVRETAFTQTALGMQASELPKGNRMAVCFKLELPEERASVLIIIVLLTFSTSFVTLASEMKLCYL